MTGRMQRIGNAVTGMMQRLLKGWEQKLSAEGSIKTRVRRVFLMTGVGGILLLSLVFLVYVLTLRGSVLRQSQELGNYAAKDTQAAQDAQIREHLISLAADKAVLLAERLSTIEKQTEIIADIAGKIYTYPERYSPRGPAVFQDRGTFTLELSGAEGALRGQNANEIYRLANIGDFLWQSTQEAMGIEGSYVGTETGIFLMMDIYQSRADAGQEPFDPRVRPWYVGAKAKGSVFWTDDFFDAIHGDKVIVCAAPIYDRSKEEPVFKGVAGNGAELSFLDVLVQRIQVGKTGYAFVINNAGKLMFSSREDHATLAGRAQVNYLKSSHAAVRAMARRMTRGETDLMPLELEGKAVYVAFHPVENINWSLAVVIPITEVIAPTERIQEQILQLTSTEIARIRRYFIFGILSVLLACGLGAAAVTLTSRRFAHSLTAPLAALAQDAQIISAGNLDHPLKVHTGDEIEDLAASFNQMIKVIRTVAGEKERVQTELDTVMRIKAGLLPKNFPVEAAWAVYAELGASTEVGGDFYDFFFTDPRQERVALVIADTREKGVTAALNMVITRTLVRSFAQMGRPFEDIFLTVNHELWENGERGNEGEKVQVTLLLCEINLHSGELAYVCAGQPPPLLARVGEPYRFMEIGGGPPLGAAADTRYREGVLRLTPGDRLYLYTGGLLDAVQKSVQKDGPQNGQASLGNERLVETVNKFRDAPPRQFDEAVRRALGGFTREDAGGDEAGDGTARAITTLAFQYVRRV